MFRQLSESGRLPAVDLMKLYASFLVILGHCVSHFVLDFDGPLYNAIWLTQMPLFFFASGFIAPTREKLDTFGKFGTRVLKNALALLVPNFTFLLISAALSRVPVLEAFRRFFEDPQYGLWFLWVLFFVHVVFDFGTFLSAKWAFKGSTLVLPTAVSASFCLLALFVPRFLGVSGTVLATKLFAYYIPFFVFGFLARAFLKSQALSSAKPWVPWTVFGIALCIVLFEVFYFPSIPAFDDNSLLFVAIRVLGSVASILVHLFLASLLTESHKLDRFAFLGSFSLQSYYLHILFLRFLPFSTDAPALQWLLSFGCAFLLVLMVAATCLVLHFLPYANLVLFGKSRSHYAFEKRLPAILR